MIYSTKTLVTSAILFTCSMLILGTMSLPVLNGQTGFQAMEDTFNSLRKGIKPPFKKIAEENNSNLGKNFNVTLEFSSNEKTRAAISIFLRNKLTVTPKGRSVNIQGDLGYTLKFFMNDINLLYHHEFDKLQQRYSMPVTYSMYMMDRILKKLSIAMASQRMKVQEKLINKIRARLLIPAYNLREAFPVSETSGLAYLTLGTIGILLFAILWDASNFLFFGTLASDNFMKKIRISLGREMSDREKALILKKKKIKQKAQAAKIKKVKGTRTNQEALLEVDGIIASRKKSKKKITKESDETLQKKKKNTVAQKGADEKRKKTSIKKVLTPTDKKTEKSKRVDRPEKKTDSAAIKTGAKRKLPTNSAADKKAVLAKRKAQPSSTTDSGTQKTSARKRPDASQTVPTTQKANTSQKANKKVTTNLKNENTNHKIVPVDQKKSKKNTAVLQSEKPAAQKKRKAKPKDKT
ncbi:hypothetical protein [Maridesulfovibrio zosterae]|uniref:hypothetical protein n=1 Tax=Maridesulfovibrio zosterae TaxID=82171 RepID=UPI000427E5E9|nr:hypothetical protein [Maridesulfovibrio zosterae]